MHLASNIDLHVSDGATLLFGTDTDDYLPVVRTRWEGTELNGYSPLIYANDVHDVAITGSGTIDGNEDSEFHAWKAQETPDQLRLRQMGFDGVPVQERVFGKGTFLRPSAIQFFDASTTSGSVTSTSTESSTGCPDPRSPAPPPRESCEDLAVGGAPGRPVASVVEGTA